MRALICLQRTSSAVARNRRTHFDLLEHVVDKARYNALALIAHARVGRSAHRERLARARLTVCKDCCVESLQERALERRHTALIEPGLRGLRPVHEIEREETIVESCCDKLLDRDLHDWKIVY